MVDTHVKVTRSQRIVPRARFIKKYLWGKLVCVHSLRTFVENLHVGGAKPLGDHTRPDI